MTPAEVANTRAILGLTQAELAAVMGLRAAAAVSEWERGKRIPDGRSVRLLWAYLEGYRPPDWPREWVV